MKYEPNWTSLRHHAIPQWLIDAKFGIYCHWGISSIKYLPEYAKLSDEQALEKFTAERFEPEEWASLFKQAGARFAGPVAWHGSPFIHWDSAISDYNSVQRNPHRDIVGEVSEAVRSHGLKFIASFHCISDDGWLELASEAIDKYLPDIVWVDASFGGTKQANHLRLLDGSRYVGTEADKPNADTPNPGGHPADVLEYLSDRFQRQFIAHYYNRAAEKEREVAFVYKSYDIPPGIGMRDLENGLLSDIAYDVWMTDIDMNKVPDWDTHGWFYRPGVPTRTAANIVHVLMDVISKNGLLLLNVPPLADGSFSDEVRNTLLTVGEWLRKHHEAVYDTSPWSLFGEGPTVIKPHRYNYHHNDHFGQTQFVPEDIRFTVKDSTLYATCLGCPKDRQVTIRTLSTRFKTQLGTILGVSMVGHDTPVEWDHGPDGLTIKLPNAIELNPLANVFRIETL